MLLSKTELEALLRLKKSSNGLDAFSLFQSLKIPFTEFTKVIKSLLESEFINEVKDDYFRISKIGEDTLKNKKASAANKHWRQVPEKFIGPKLKKHSFYIPSLRLLDKNTFNINDDEIES